MANNQQANQQAGPTAKKGSMRVDFGKKRKQNVRAVHRTNMNRTNMDTQQDSDADDAPAGSPS